MISSATRRCSALGQVPAKRIFTASRGSCLLQTGNQRRHLNSSSSMADTAHPQEADLRQPLKTAAYNDGTAAIPAGAPAGICVITEAEASRFYLLGIH